MDYRLEKPGTPQGLVGRRDEGQHAKVKAAEAERKLLRRGSWHLCGVPEGLWLSR